MTAPDLVDDRVLAADLDDVLVDLGDFVGVTGMHAPQVEDL